MNRGLAGFAARYPLVWHVMEAEGAGCATLYPAASLRARSGLPTDSANRNDFQIVTLPGGATAILRAQLMHDERLCPTLAGIFTGQPERWRDHVNQHVFFWAGEDRRDRFAAACIRLRARGAIGSGPPPVTLAFDTASLLNAHAGTAHFSRINTGSTVRGGARVRRDEMTLRPVSNWNGERVAELAIRGSVPIESAVR